MLSEAQLNRMARVLIWALGKARNRPFRRGEVIRLAFDIPGVRLAEILHGRLVRSGYHVVIRPAETPVMERQFYEQADNRQLVFVSAGTRELSGSLNGSIYISAPESLTHLQNVDSARLGATLRARKPFKEILRRREERDLFGWTFCVLPTRALADKSGLSLKEYTRQIVKACYLDKPDPVREWERVFRKTEQIRKWLDGLGIRTLHVESRRIDLTITLGQKRRWMGGSGRNVPSFEIFTSPDWRGAEGVYYSDLPAYLSGNFVKGVKLEFRKGNVVRIASEAGERFVKKMLAVDEGAKRIGEFSLTDKRFSRIDKFMAETLFDENFGGRHGNCHLAVGSSYSDTFDGNPARLTKERKKVLGFNDSSLHWDMVNTEPKRVSAIIRDGSRVLIYENGSFNI